MSWADIESVLRQNLIEFFYSAASFPSSPKVSNILTLVLAFYGALTLARILANFQWIPSARKKGMTELMRWRFDLGLVLFIFLAAFQIFHHFIRSLPNWASYYQAYIPVALALDLAVFSLLFMNFTNLVWRGIAGDYKTSLWSRLKYVYGVTAESGINTYELLSVPIAFLLPWKCIFQEIALKIQT